jgi:dimethylamine---corrinoid protein Co-methyltransferase
VGTGDILGMPAAHAIASGLNGIRAAGDLVARMQMARGMRLPQAKRHVADRLGVGLRDLSDNVAMDEVRHELGLGRVMDTEAVYPSDPLAMEAKTAVAELLDVPINCVSRSQERAAAAVEAVKALPGVASRGARS